MLRRVLFRVKLQKMRRKQRNVFTPRAQRRQLQRDDV